MGDAGGREGQGIPGKGDQPEESLLSPSGLVVARKRGSSWLYSTFIVIFRPSMCVRQVIAPIASWAFLGTASEFTS